MAAPSNHSASHNADSTPPPESALSRAALRRLRRHSDYQRVYKAGKKQFSSNMTYFSAAHPSDRPWPAARVGLTAGRALGGAVQRNRIKRRMREAVRAHHALLPASIDVILHPRRSVLSIPIADLGAEVERIFRLVSEKYAQTAKKTA